MAVASKKVLIVCPDIQDANASWVQQIYTNLENGNVPVLAPKAGDIDWLNDDAVHGYLSQQKLQFIVVALPQGIALPRLLADTQQRDMIVAALTAMADYAARTDIPLLYISNYRVFGAEAKNIYYEGDEPGPITELGETLVALEAIVSSRLEKYLILRTSWVIDGEGENLFTSILQQLMTGKTMLLSRRSRGCPTWSDDLVRVLCGVIRQVMAGAENWGAFHYCSSDATTQWEFGQEVMQMLLDWLADDDSLQGTLIMEERQTDVDVADKTQVASASLSCRRIRNNFGVHGRSWRQGLSRKVGDWLEEHYPALVKESAVPENAS